MKKRQNQVACPICRDTLSVSRTPEPAFMEEHVMPRLAIRTYFCRVREITCPRFSLTKPQKYPHLHDRDPRRQVDFDRALFDLQAGMHAAEMGGRDSPL